MTLRLLAPMFANIQATTKIITTAVHRGGALPTQGSQMWSCPTFGGIVQVSNRMKSIDSPVAVWTLSQIKLFCQRSERV